MNVKGFNYIDFDQDTLSEHTHRAMTLEDLCDRIDEAIADEIQATMDYKGMVTHYDALLSDDMKKDIVEISNDETDHRAMFEVMKRKLGC